LQLTVHQSLPLVDIELSEDIVEFEVELIVALVSTGAVEVDDLFSMLHDL
jgi:hypothetical protein